jgi:rubrerythrin
MKIDLNTLIARLRQIQALDINAHSIYEELANLTEDSKQRKILSQIAQDEKRHIVLGKEMLLLLER